MEIRGKSTNMHQSENQIEIKQKKSLKDNKLIKSIKNAQNTRYSNIAINGLNTQEMKNDSSVSLDYFNSIQSKQKNEENNKQDTQYFGVSVDNFREIIFRDSFKDEKFVNKSEQEMKFQSFKSEEISEENEKILSKIKVKNQILPEIKEGYNEDKDDLVLNSPHFNQSHELESQKKFSFSLDNTNDKKKQEEINKSNKERLPLPSKLNIVRINSRNESNDTLQKNENHEMYIFKNRRNFYLKKKKSNFNTSEDIIADESERHMTNDGSSYYPLTNNVKSILTQSKDFSNTMYQSGSNTDRKIFLNDSNKSIDSNQINLGISKNKMNSRNVNHVNFSNSMNIFDKNIGINGLNNETGSFCHNLNIKDFRERLTKYKTDLSQENTIQTERCFGNKKVDICQDNCNCRIF